MAKVRVWNDNVHPYKEMFKGDQISIGAKEFILMEEDEAIQFRGTFAPMVFDADGNDTPEGYKKIRIEKITAEMATPKAEEFQCMACKYKATSKADLDEHSKASHSEIIAKDEQAEEEIKKRKRAS